MSKLAYITMHNPHDRATWSGLNYYIMKALEGQGYSLQVIYGLKGTPDWPMKLRYRWHQLWGRNEQYERSYTYARQFAAQIDARLDSGVDAIFTNNAAFIPCLRTPKPIYLYTDATFHNLAEYYDHFSHLPRRNKRMADDLERQAFERCTHLFFASQWAADTAMEYYGADPAKLSVVPFGANLDQVPRAAELMESIGQKKFDCINFLLVGVEYERKGVPKAIEIVRQLRDDYGFNARLIVAGLRDLAGRGLPAFVTDAGFLSKEVPEQAEKLQQLYAQAHFFLMPAEKECYGVVFAEANAFGLPCFASAISGITTIIRQGENGALLPPDADAHAYVQAILPYLLSNQHYQQIARQSRIAFDRRLNWGMAGIRLSEKMQATIAYKQE